MKPARGPFALATAIVAASGWLLAQAWPLSGPRALAFVALVPFLLVVRSSRPRAAVALGAVWMLSFAWGINEWFAPAVSRHFEVSPIAGFGAFLGVTLFTAAPATMIFAGIVSLSGPHPRASAPLVAAAAWTAGEWLRTEFLGDPWGLLAYSQAVHPVWLQTADFAGVYGPGFAIMLVNACIAEALLSLAAPVRARPLLRLAAVAALPLVALAYGQWRLSEPRTNGDPFSVVLVQGNLEVHDQWLRSAYSSNLAVYRSATGSALEAGPADLVVWPENAVTFLLDAEDSLRGTLPDVLSRGPAMLLTGGPRYDRAGAPGFYNSAFLLSPAGEIVATYDKQRLLPFGEFSPLGLSEAAAAEEDEIRQFRPGPDAAALPETAQGQLGVVICNEALFPEPSAERVRAGAGLLVALTNDSWVGEPDFAEQAFEQAIVRAVEQRRWLLRSSTAGPSAIVDDAGRIVARTPYGVEATLRGEAAMSEVTTLYSRIGDAFAWSCVLAAAFVAFRSRSNGTPRE